MFVCVGWGRIVNIASTHGLVGSINKSAYVASKHGIVGLTKVCLYLKLDHVIITTGVSFFFLTISCM